MIRIVGGSFVIAGDKVAGYIAQQTKPDWICGGANGDGNVNIGDAAYMANYVFQQDTPAPCAGCE